MFDGVASSMSWANGDIALPWERAPNSTSGRRRRLLSEDGGLSQAARLATWSGVIIAPVLIVHYLTVLALAAYKPQWRPSGLLDFPQLPLTVSLLLINPYASAAARVLAASNATSVAIGLAFLLLLPVPIVAFATVQVYRHAFSNKTRSLRQVQGAWTGSWDVKNKYGAFFKDVRGPPHEWHDCGALYDPNFKRYVPTQPVACRVSKVASTLPLFFVPYEYARNIVVILILGGFSETPHAALNGNLPQVALLFGISFAHVSLLYFATPLSSLRAGFVEGAASFGEFGTYAAAFMLVVARRINPLIVPKLLPIIDKLLLMAQLLAILSKLGAQIGSLYALLPQLLRMVRMKTNPTRVYEADRARVLAFKYACRWYFRVYGRPPPSRAAYFKSRQPKEIWEDPSNKANYLVLKYGC